MRCHSRPGYDSYYQAGAKKWHLPVDSQLIQFLTHDEGFGVVVRPSAVGVRQLDSDGPHPSYQPHCHQRHPSSHTTDYYFTPFMIGPIPAETRSPSAVSDTIKSPSRLFGFFVAGTLRNPISLYCLDEWSCFRTGNASLRKRTVWGVQSGNQGRWWQKDNRRISNHVRSVFSPLTDISTQGWLFLLSLLVSYLLEAKAQNGICPRRSFRSS